MKAGVLYVKRCRSLTVRVEAVKSEEDTISRIRSPESQDKVRGDARLKIRVSVIATVISTI